jgi:hypothetical protein
MILESCLAETCSQRKLHYSKETPIMKLEILGWSDTLAQAFADCKIASAIPGRITSEHKGQYQLQTEAGEFSATVTGKLRHQAIQVQDYPASRGLGRLQLSDLQSSRQAFTKSYPVG